MKRIHSVCLLLTLPSLVACGHLANQRAAGRAAAADHPACPSEQVHVRGPVELPEGSPPVYRIEVCGRDRYYTDANPGDEKREFSQTKRPQGLSDGHGNLWADTDGTAAEGE